MEQGRSRIVVSASARARIDAALEWLLGWPRDAEVVVVAANLDAADELVRAAVRRGGPRFGVHRFSLGRLAGVLAEVPLAREALVPASELMLGAVVWRAVHEALLDARLTHFAPVARLPGFPRALARTFTELRMAAVDPRSIEASGVRGGAEIAWLVGAIERELERAGLADRARVLEIATERARDGRSPFRGMPLLSIDVPIATRREEALWGSLSRAAAACFAAAPTGDARSIEVLEAAIGRALETLDDPRATTSLGRMRGHLFEAHPPPRADLDATVQLTAQPGEARECVEIVRAIHAEASKGVPLDRMAILLRAPLEYVGPLREAFERAELPAYFARGATRPHPAGRALLALLACAAEGLSARRFAEYLSLSQVPSPEDAAPIEVATPTDTTLLGHAAARLGAEQNDDGGLPASIAEPARREGSIVAGSLRAPWRWEQILVDAAVVGGLDRWRRRLEGHAAELALRAQEAAAEDEARSASLSRERADLAALAAFALPLVEQLASLPQEALWGEWLLRLGTLARVALRDPAPVLATLAELEPLANVGPARIDEVVLVLSPRLRELPVAPPERRYGSVFVAPIELARGLSFDVVFVPGLAERVFPRKILEDPVLLDVARSALSPSLERQAERAASERMALRVAVGAAEARVWLSYPRLEVAQSRPRVASFYAVEALRSAEGDLRRLEHLTRAAASPAGSAVKARLGWPAPARPEDALDAAEYDLALLGEQAAGDAAGAKGAASYLLGANAHLARALRARARRWLKRWTPADGLVDPDEIARAALQKHALSARAYSATALQGFAACPYRFFLQAIMRLSPWEDAAPLETLDPLTRGSLFHDAQFEVQSDLRTRGQLPVRRANLDVALDAADRALGRVAARYHDDLAPAIERVWQDSLLSLRTDLREWLRQEADRDDGYVPDRFELSFGLKDRDRTYEDPASVDDAIALDVGLTLRGSIDLVELHAAGHVRVTDHKTGKLRAKEGFVVGGGEHLQPVLYALACERLLGRPVREGRLYYCTSDGGYAERSVPIDDAAASAAEAVAKTIGQAIDDGFLPAAPAPNACRFCDYTIVCGTLEEQRTQRKPSDRLDPLLRLRAMK